MVEVKRVRKVRSPFFTKQTVLRNGISLGSALAMILSYVEHRSILWAIFHGILSWIYVIYFVIVYRII